MSKIIIGIHGLGNKPPEETLNTWWEESICEGLEGIGKLRRSLNFQLVYWTHYLYPTPLDPTVKDKENNSDTDTMWVHVLDITHPLADAGPDQEVPQGSNVTFNGSASRDNVGIVNWTWIFPYNGTKQTLYGERPNFIFWTPGIYNISLSVVDSENNSDTDNILIDVTRTGKNRFKVCQRKSFSFYFFSSQNEELIITSSYTTLDHEKITYHSIFTIYRLIYFKRQ